MAKTRPGRTILLSLAVGAAVLVPAVAAAQGVTCEGNEPTIVGTEGADDLVGTEKRDVIDGLGGDDRIRGLGGNDTLCGGPGNDRLESGGGTPERPVDRTPTADLLVGADGDDYLTGGYGTYSIGGPGDDTFVGAMTVSYFRAPNGVVADLGTGHAFGEGSDTLVGVDTLRGSAFDDRLSGDERRNDISGGSGDDELWGAGHSDELNGGDGNDLVIGEDGDDFRMYGGAGDDFVSGGDGDDVIQPEIFTLRSDHDVGDDYVDGGDGWDTVFFDLGISTSIDLDLAEHVATGQGNDEVWDFERVEGTNGNDRIAGDEWDNDLKGRGGTDVIVGGAGDDWLDPAYYDGQTLAGEVVQGGGGDDTLYAHDCCGQEPLQGGQGRDTISFSVGGSFPRPLLTVDLRSLSWHTPRTSGSFKSIENVRGSIGDDVIVGDNRRNVLDGAWGHDDVRALGSDDVLIGGPDRDDLDGGPGFDVCRDPADRMKACER